DASFVIVGDGRLRGEMESLADDLGLSERVTFVGNRDDLATIYAGIDVVALTSLNEGTPPSLIEGMAAGRPVTASEDGGVTDLLGEVEGSHSGFSVRERGLGVTSGDVDGFAEGLIYLAKNESLRFDLGERGKHFAQRNYGKQRLIDE